MQKDRRSFAPWLLAGTSSYLIGDKIRALKYWETSIQKAEEKLSGFVIDRIATIDNEIASELSRNNYLT